MYDFNRLLDNTYVQTLVMFIISVLLPSALYFSMTSPALKKRESKPYPRVFAMLILGAVSVIASYFNMTMLYLVNSKVLDVLPGSSAKAVATWNIFNIFIDTTPSQVLQIDTFYGNAAISVQALLTTLFTLFFAFAIIRVSDAVKTPLNTLLRFLFMIVFFVIAGFNQLFIPWYALGGPRLYVISDYINTVTYFCAAAPFVAFPLTMILSGFAKRRMLDKANEAEKLNAQDETEKHPAIEKEQLVEKEIIKTEYEVPDSVVETVEESSRDTLQETLDRVSQVEASVVALSSDRAAELSKKLEDEKARKDEEERLAAEEEERARAELEAFPEENAVTQAFSSGYGNVGEIMTDIDFESADDEDEDISEDAAADDTAQTAKRPAAAVNSGIGTVATQHSGASHGNRNNGKRRNKKKKKKK